MRDAWPCAPASDAEIQAQLRQIARRMLYAGEDVKTLFVDYYEIIGRLTENPCAACGKTHAPSESRRKRICEAGRKVYLEIRAAMRRDLELAD